MIEFIKSADRVYDHPVTLGVTCGQHIESPTVIDFLDRNYSYKSVNTQILHDARLELIP